MNKKNMMGYFLRVIYDRNLATKFIINLFGYDHFFDYNYMFRFIEEKNNIVIDIYDNVTDTKFNRYIFNFSKCDYIYKKDMVDSLNIHYISVWNSVDSENNLIKLAYLFKIDVDKMILYMNDFLDEEFVSIMNDIIK